MKDCWLQWDLCELSYYSIVTWRRFPFHRSRITAPIVLFSPIVQRWILNSHIAPNIKFQIGYCPLTSQMNKSNKFLTSNCQWIIKFIAYWFLLNLLHCTIALAKFWTRHTLFSYLLSPNAEDNSLIIHFCQFLVNRLCPITPSSKLNQLSRAHFRDT